MYKYLVLVVVALVLAGCGGGGGGGAAPAPVPPATDWELYADNVYVVAQRYGSAGELHSPPNRHVRVSTPLGGGAEIDLTWIDGVDAITCQDNHGRPVHVVSFVDLDALLYGYPGAW